MKRLETELIISECHWDKSLLIKRIDHPEILTGYINIYKNTVFSVLLVVLCVQLDCFGVSCLVLEI